VKGVYQTAIAFWIYGGVSNLELDLSTQTADGGSLSTGYLLTSHPGLFRETSPYTVDLDIQNNLDQLLEMVAQANLYAVIAFRTGPGRKD
jgi:hypothetical protein